MPLLERLAAVVARLRPLGWDALLARHGLDLGAPDLAAELQRPLQPDRTAQGFEDFALADPFGHGVAQAVQPRDPRLSLLFHALASPRVRIPDPALDRPENYATLEELDLLENYIYSLRPPSPAELEGLVVGVFAYEYRAASATTHRRHADFVYSRAGVARIGEAPAFYDARQRSHVRNPGEPDKFAVAPSKFGAFLARRVRGAAEVSLMGLPVDDDDRRTFLLPVYKLFAGEECLPGRILEVTYSEFHRSEKLRRAVTIGGLRIRKDRFDENRAPFLRESPDPDLVGLRRVGAVVLVAPPAQALVRRARQICRDGVERTATYSVQPASLGLNRHFTSSYMLVGNLLTAAEEGLGMILRHRFGERPPKVRPRQAPEFLNMRLAVDENGAEVDLNAIPGAALDGVPQDDFVHTMKAGGYEAALFEDGLCDGCVAVQVAGLAADLPSLPAFSLVSPPDFFPGSSEMDIEAWVDKHTEHNFLDQFKEGGPDPLCRGRFAANPTLRLPTAPASAAFDPADETIVAIVGRAFSDAAGATWSRADDRPGTFMTDAASNEFAPGWDVTYSESGGRFFYATFGLGSPFVEDAKFCASANAYWPAASPDASRTFHRQDTPTAIPLLDAELGYHPDHPLVQSGAVVTSVGWDGEQGPFFTDDTRRTVSFTDIIRSDYVRNALEGRLGRSSLLDQVDSAELIRRMDCLRFCIQALPGSRNETPDPKDHVGLRLIKRVDSTRLWLVRAEAVAEWAALDPHLAGPGYLYEFAIPADAKPVPDNGVARRQTQAVDAAFVCRVTTSKLGWSRDGAAFDYTAAPA